MNDEFITTLFKNKDVKEIVITNENNLYQITADGHTVSNHSFLYALDDLYKLVRYDPIKLSIGSYINFMYNNRCIDKNTFEYKTELYSTILPPSYEELEKNNIEFVSQPVFYANGKQYECVSRQYVNSDKIDYSVYKWLYRMSYDSNGDCIVSGVLKVNA